jgi:hypothetical protein
MQRTDPFAVQRFRDAVAACRANGKPPTAFDLEAFRQAAEEVFAPEEAEEHAVQLRRPKVAKPSCVVTFLVVVDAEKPLDYLRYFFTGLVKWNRDWLDKIQVIVLCQRQHDSETLRIAAEQPFPVDVVHCRHEFVGDYPMWDVMAACKRAWGLVEGRYVTWAHPEFLLCADRLGKLCEFLEDKRPFLVLGNLRRLSDSTTKESCCDLVRKGEEESLRITRRLDEGQYGRAAAEAEYVKSTHWPWWRYKIQPGKVVWVEDQFFARKDWLDAIHFFDHTDRLIFQDIYDLMGQVCHQLGQYGLDPQCIRVDQEIHRAVHLWHPRMWASWKPEIRDWFLSNPARWEDTWFASERMWNDILNRAPDDFAPIQATRIGRYGTTTRFGRAFEDWLVSGGIQELADFYRREGCP